MDYLSRIKKQKTRRIIVLSASSIHSGLECIVIEIENNEWHILLNQSIHYSPQIKEMIQFIQQDPEQSIRIKDFAILDNLMTIYLTENVQQTIAQLSSRKKRIDLIVLQKVQLFRGLVNEKKAPQYWNLDLGDAHHVASVVKVPVLTDCARHHILGGGSGVLSLAEGDFLIGRKTGGVCVFVDIGLSSHITAIDTETRQVIIDSDTGPGTCLIDIAAQDAGFKYGFDRDGSGALTGAVMMTGLEALIADEWFKTSAPKEADPGVFKNLLNHPTLQSISAHDRLATLTALTALSINLFFKKEYTYAKKSGCIWLSGGGAHNLALVDFIKSYFAPLPVKSCEELGIPANSKTALVLGLTVNAFINNEFSIIKPSSSGRIEKRGRWIFP
jgi:anhydro-N-acetylmuramic acid kinase